jgi:hypothetical protein
MADRANAAEPLDEHGDFPEWPALDEPLEAAELHDVQPGLGDLVVLIEKNRDLAVTLDSGYRLDDDPLEFFYLCRIYHFSLRFGLFNAEIAEAAEKTESKSLLSAFIRVHHCQVFFSSSLRSLRALR